VSAGFIDELSAKMKDDFVPVCAETSVHLIGRKEELYKKLELIRICMRRRSGDTDFKVRMIVRNGSSVLEVCDKVHRRIKDEFRYAQIWGKSVKFGGQKVGLTHKLMDEDVLTLITR